MTEENLCNECGVVTIEIPSRYSFLRIVRQAVSATCVHAGLSEFRAAELEMAVDEVCARIIEHRATNRSEEPPIRISMNQKEDRVVVEFSSVASDVEFGQGQEVDADAIEAVAEKQVLGSYVVKRFVDTIDVSEQGRAGSYNLRLTKIL